MRRSWGLLAFCLVVFGSRAASANDDSWTPSDFDDPPLNLSLTPRPPAPPEPRRDLEPRVAPFGARGQFAIFAGASASASYLTYQSGANESQVNLDPAVFFFPIDHLAVGLHVQLAYDDATFFTPRDLTNTKTFDFFVGPSLAYDFAFSRYVSLFPIATFEIGTVSKQQRVIRAIDPNAAPVAAASNTEADAVMLLEAPLLFHPAQNFSLGLGPTLEHDFAKTEGYPDIGSQTTRLGGSLFLLGHWGGDLPPENLHAAPPRRFESHLGTDRTFVLEGDLALGGSWKSLPATHSTQSQFSVGGSFQRFIGAGVSLGAGASIAVARGDDLPSDDGTSYSITTIATGLSGSGGYAHTIGGPFVFYPRATLSFGVVSQTVDVQPAPNARNNGLSNHDNDEEVFVTAGLYAPIDYEIAPHFFMGFGPYVSRDIVRTAGPGEPNISTTAGASLELGTWL